MGLPRSGTTLVYQYIVHRLQVSYFTNGAGYYYLSPCIVTFWQWKRYGSYISDFASEYGKVKGPTAPREAGSFWGRFFGFENYVVYESVKSKDVRTLRNTIACIQWVFGDLPFVNKNVKHLLRIDALSQIFPNAVFLIVERNLADVALSIHRARYRNLADPNKWWSVKPENYELLRHLSVPQQIAGQLISLQQRMTCDLEYINSQRIIRIQYETFCKNPEAIIDLLKSSLGYVGWRSKSVEQFAISRNVSTSEEENLLVNLLTKQEQ